MSYGETEKIWGVKTLLDIYYIILINCTGMDMGKKYALLMVRFCIVALRIFSSR